METQSDDQRKRSHLFSAWLPVLLGIALIALSSTDMFGANHTSGPLRWLYQSLFGPVSTARWNQIHTHIRKTGHFLGYGTLGLLWLRAWWMALPRSRFLTDALLALLGTALVASSDELHQAFLPDRTGRVQDVLLDCCGAIILQILVYVFMRVFKPKRLKRAK